MLCQHLVVVGRRDLQMGADLPVGDGIDLQRLHSHLARRGIGIEI